MLIAQEEQIHTQINRACSAQSPEMLPKTPPTPVDKEAKIRNINAKINSYFND